MRNSSSLHWNEFQDVETLTTGYVKTSLREQRYKTFSTSASIKQTTENKKTKETKLLK